MISEKSLKESSVAAKQFATKLKNMKEHLKALSDKKNRLDLEIKQLKHAIREKQQNYSKTTMTSLKREHGIPLIDQLGEAGLLTEEHKSEILALKEFDSELRSVTALLEEIDTYLY